MALAVDHRLAHQAEDWPTGPEAVPVAHRFARGTSADVDMDAMSVAQNFASRTMRRLLGATENRRTIGIAGAHAKLVERSGAKLILVNVKREPEE